MREKHTDATFARFPTFQDTYIFLRLYVLIHITVTGLFVLLYQFPCKIHRKMGM